MRKLLLHIFLCCAISSNAQDEHYLLIGTYTGGKSEGIYVYKFNSATAENTLVSVTKSSNPSFLTVSPNEKIVYAVNENADSNIVPAGGTVTAFAFNNGILTPINQQPSGGKHPCYISIDKSGQWIFTGNYSSGTVGVLPVNKDGSLNSLKQIIQHRGSSINAQRQQAPHVHAALLSANNKYLYVPDLGIDKVMVYAFNKKKGTLKLKSSAASEPGNGPRHFDIDAQNKFAYLMEELTGTVVCYKVKKGKLIFQQRISALPAGFKGGIGSADIHISPDGKFLYCSNRGDANTISIFSIHPADGKLTLIGHQSTLGIKPRNFNFDPGGNFLLAANQSSDEIVIFKIDKATGLLTDTGKRIAVGNPVCIKWIH
jgi:6-phosphogluconolactonase